MPAALKIRTDPSGDDLRRLAARSKDANQGRRLRPLAAVLEGRSRVDAARIGGINRQTLRDGMQRFNKPGPDRQGNRVIDLRLRSCVRGAGSPCPRAVRIRVFAMGLSVVTSAGAVWVRTRHSPSRKTMSMTPSRLVSIAL